MYYMGLTINSKHRNIATIQVFTLVVCYLNYNLSQYYLPWFTKCVISNVLYALKVTVQVNILNTSKTSIDPIYNILNYTDHIYDSNLLFERTKITRKS